MSRALLGRQGLIQTLTAARSSWRTSLLNLQGTVHLGRLVLMQHKLKVQAAAARLPEHSCHCCRLVRGIASDAAPKKRLALAPSCGCTTFVLQSCRKLRQPISAPDSGWTCTHAEHGQHSRSSSLPGPSLFSSAGLTARQSGGPLGSLKQLRPMSAALKQLIAEQLEQVQAGEPGAGPPGPAEAQADLRRQQSQMEGVLQQRLLSGSLQQGVEAPALQRAGAGSLAGQGAGQAAALPGPGAGLQQAAASPLAGPQQGAGQAAALQGPGAGLQLAAASPLAGPQQGAGLQLAAASPLAGPQQGAGQAAALQGPGAGLQQAAASPLAGPQQGAGQAETVQRLGVAPPLAAFAHVGRPQAAAGPQSEPRGLESLRQQHPTSAVHQQAVLLRSQDRQAAEQTGQAQQAQTGLEPQSLPTRPGKQPAGPQQAAEVQSAQLQGFAEAALQSRAVGLGAPQAGWHPRQAQTGSEPQSLPTRPEQQPAGPQQADEAQPAQLQGFAEAALQSRAVGLGAPQAGWHPRQAQTGSEPQSLPTRPEQQPAGPQQAARAQLAQLQGFNEAALQSSAVGLGAPLAGWHPQRQLGHLRQPRPMSAALQQVIRQQSTMLQEQEALQEAAAYGIDAPGEGQHAALESLAQAPRQQASDADDNLSLSGAGRRQSRELQLTNAAAQLQHPQRPAHRLAVAGQSASGTGTPEQQPPATGSGLQLSSRTGSLDAAAVQAAAARLMPQQQQQRMKAGAAAQRLSAPEAGAADRAAAVASHLHPLQQQNRPMSAGMKTLLQQQRSLLAEQVSTFFGRDARCWVGTA